LTDIDGASFGTSLQKGCQWFESSPLAQNQQKTGLTRRRAACGLQATTRTAGGSHRRQLQPSPPRCVLPERQLDQPVAVEQALTGVPE
jgi:hypothetical protein